MKEFFISLARDSISVRNESIHGQAKGRELDLGVVLYIHTHTHIDLDEENVCVRVSDGDKICFGREIYAACGGVACGYHASLMAT